MVDKSVLAARVASIRDAVARVRLRLPASAQLFKADRDTREIVTLNLFVAIQDCLALAAHWVTDAGWDVPATYGAAFDVLAERGILERELAGRLRAAAGLRNLLAHQYGSVDAERLYAAARQAQELADFADVLAARAAGG